MSYTLFIVAMVISNLILLMAISIPFFYQIKGIYFKNRYQQSIVYIKQVLGYLITIFGKIRTGKTSLASSIIHIYTLLFQGELTEMINKTKIMFKSVDFNVLDHFIFEAFEENGFDHKQDFDAVTSLVIQYFNLDPDGHYYDFIKDKSVKELIYDYVFGVYVLFIRNNYVMSNISIYNRITGNYSFQLETRWLEVRNAYNNMDFGIDDYMILFIDEITDDKSASMWNQDAKDESGYKEYLRKFGRYHQERNRLLSTKQDAFDEVRKNRNLTQSNIHLSERVKTTNTNRLLFALVSLPIRFRICLYKGFTVFRFLLKVLIRPKMIKGFKQHFAAFYDYNFARINFERNMMNRIFFWDQFLFSFGFNVYKIKNYDDIEEVGKKDLGEEFVVITPTIHGFGTYETHLAKHDFKQLKQRSKTVIKESNPYDIKSRFNSEERGVNDDRITL